MTTVRYTADGGTYRVGGHSFEPGDERDVDDELAGYLADHEDFEVVGDTDEAVHEEDGTFQFDPGDAEDFEANGWLDNDYQDRADAVLAGGLDDYLDEIQKAETSDTVIDAVEERRDDLEG